MNKQLEEATEYRTLTSQEVFDRVWEHFVVGRASASKDDFVCLYRGDGTKCAAGLFIPDERYAPEIEGEVPRKLLTESAGWWFFPEVAPADYGLLRMLAKHHDYSAMQYSSTQGFVTDFTVRLISVANQFGLTVPTIPADIDRWIDESIGH